MNIWAKKIKETGKLQTLEEHTLWVVEEAIKLIDENTLEKVSKISGWQKEKIKDLIFFSAYFHDIGKATVEFQNTILNEKKSYHPLYSAYLLLYVKDFEYKDEGLINLLVSVVLTHHTLFPKYYDNADFNFTFLSEYKTFLENYKTLYENIFDKECNYNFNFKEINIKSYQAYIKILQNNLKKIKNFSKLRILYSYVSGVLNLADWLASAKFNNNTMPQIFFKRVPTKETFYMKLPFAKDDLRDFQKKLAKTNQSVLVEIPTGEGKTEGSLLWAINNIKNPHTKIVYTMPTTTTSNKLYERVKSFFDENECGLIHSNAKSYLEKEYEKDNGKVDENFKSDFLISKSFNKPITVSTIDSLLKYFINIGRFNIATKNLLNSVIIIDEVHAYDLKLMGFLKRFLEICDEFNIKVCLMSASIPNKIKELLGLDRYKVITQKELFNKKANEIIKKDKLLEEDINEIIQKYKNGKNVLIIKNTVNSAKNVYHILKDKVDDIVLFHSEFRKIDKNEKENLIFKKLDAQKPFILIATQIVEISLDIDFDVMFSDVAPIDSLIQRFGRVNRKKNPNKKGEIYIYKVKKANPYRETILNLSFQTIKNGYFELSTYIEWLNFVYDELFKKDISLKNEISNLFKEGYQKFDKTIRELNGINKSLDNYDLRDIEKTKIDYLLYNDYIAGNVGYEYTISLYSYYEKYEHKLPLEINNYLKYKVLNIDYSFEDGIVLNKNEIEDLFIDD